MGNAAIQAGKRATYPAYKPSGAPWLGDVPEHWEVRRLKYTADLINQKVDGAVADLPYMGLEHIESWTGKRLGQNGDASSDGQANLFRRGDVLFGKLRPYLAKAYAADSEGICTGELLVLRPKAVEQRFLLDYVLNPDFVTIVDSSTYGAKMPRANWDFIGNLPALVPPLAEQKAIAAFLDRETARIDALIEKKRLQIELLQEKRSALISHAVTKGLDPNAPMKDSGIEWLGQIPEHWEAKRLKFLCMFITSGSRGWAQYYSDTGPVFIRIGNLTRDGIDLRTDDLQRVDPPSGAEGDRTRTRAGDLLISVTAYIGSVAVVPDDLEEAYVNQHTALARLRSNAADSRWVAYCLASASGQQQFRALVYGGTKEGLSLEDVGDLRVILPPIAEQRAIANYIDGEYGRTQRLIAKSAKSIDTLQELRTALISTAVTGKIDVRSMNNGQ